MYVVTNDVQSRDRFGDTHGNFNVTGEASVGGMCLPLGLYNGTHTWNVRVIYV
jgi:hypothetical protein